MYYKVLKDGKVIDVLNQIVYLKHQKKHDIMLLCDKSEANAISSSDGKHVWYENSLEPLEYKTFDKVELEEIDIYEYERLKTQCLMTYEEIIDVYTISLIEGGLL